jgi:hypothetical protein
MRSLNAALGTVYAPGLYTAYAVVGTLWTKIDVKHPGCHADLGHSTCLTQATYLKKPCGA